MIGNWRHRLCLRDIGFNLSDKVELDYCAINVSIKVLIDYASLFSEE
jgi:hypothetical protein